MTLSGHNKYTDCIINPEATQTRDNKGSLTQVFYGSTPVYEPFCREFEKHLGDDEIIRADRFHFNRDRETYIASHGLLRLVLARKLGISPQHLTFQKDSYGKPSIPGNPLYFNLTHVQDAFAFVISGRNYTGIDMESINRNIDLFDIMRRVFSHDECEFIMEQNKELRERFFFLWTRKEALLKAAGTGLINNLSNLEVLSEKIEAVESVLNIKPNYIINDKHFIYSQKIMEYFISIALPFETEIKFTCIGYRFAEKFLDWQLNV